MSYQGSNGDRAARLIRAGFLRAHEERRPASHLQERDKRYEDYGDETTCTTGGLMAFAQSG
jgi:hypothetical protein